MSRRRKYSPEFKREARSGHNDLFFQRQESINSTNSLVVRPYGRPDALPARGASYLKSL